MFIAGHQDHKVLVLQQHGKFWVEGCGRDHPPNHHLVCRIIRMQLTKLEQCGET